MNIFSKLLLVSIFILSAWGLFRFQHSLQQLDDNFKLFYQSQQSTERTLEEIQLVVAELEGIMQKIGQQAEAEQQEKLQAVQNKVDLLGAIDLVNRANSLRLNEKTAEAATLLEKAKEPIWKLGDTFPKFQSQLQGLMQPIDVLMQAWQAGDAEKDPSEIQTTLESVLAELG